MFENEFSLGNVFENDGQKIIYTNFWDSEAAKQGFYFLSGNAGAFRLCLPVTVHTPKTSFLRQNRGLK